MSLMGKYEYVIDKTHPRANGEGQVYLHIIIAEKNLGRHLLPEETIHHRDLNKLNNNPDNLMVFATKSDHTRFHKIGCNENMLSTNSNGAYVCLEHKRMCVDCGKMITKWGIRCRDCANKHSRKIERPTSKELLNTLIDCKGNFTYLSEIYGVSDNAIRKWCDSYGLSRKSRDYK